ncbi:MAG: carboxymuconolactone decarboxylase family protein, partial [Acidimicrobiales bacterium]
HGRRSRQGATGARRDGAVTDARIAMLDEKAALEVARGTGIPDQLARLHVFRLLLRRASTAKALSDLLLSLLVGEALDPRLRELVIMRVAWVTGSVYEWTQHWAIARHLGVPEGDLVGVRNWEMHDVFRPEDRAVLAAADECLSNGAVDGARLEELKAHLGDDATLELLITIGAWTMVSTVLRSTAVPLEEGLSPWPPDGRQPPDTRPVLSHKRAE